VNVPGGPELLIILLVLFFVVVVPVWGIVDAAVRPDSEWQRAEQSKIVWVLVQVFLWTIGAVVYFIAIRPKLRRSANP
jgi:predicted membrane channel-forming protein YqfA (hemolysin III family)